MEVINKPMRKTIKVMAVTCQTAQFISLMPKPKDFVTRIVGDVVYLSAKVQKLSDDMNRLLDQYADIPMDYIMTQMNSITSSAARVVERVGTYTQNMVNQTVGLAENTNDILTSLTGDAIDIVNETSKAVVSLGGAVAHTSSYILGQEDIATDIHSGVEEILEWTDNGFEKVKSEAIAPLNKIAQTLEDKKNRINDEISNKVEAITTPIQEGKEWVETLLNKLRDAMDKLSSKLDTGFKDVTGVNSISKGAAYVTEALTDAENKNPTTQAVTEISKSIAYVIDNFSIAKVIKAFGGVLVESVIVKTGLNNLPPINVESMLTRISDDLTISNEDLFRQLDILTNDALDDLNDLSKEMADDSIPSESKSYGSKRYNEFIQQYNEEINKQREDIRISMKTTTSIKGDLSTEQQRAKAMLERRAMKSGIKEVKKFRRQVKNAKKSSKLIEIVSEELNNLKKEFEYTSNQIRSDWEQMMKQYKDAIGEITEFFKNGGDGDQFIDDCCARINQDCNDIKDLCTNIGTQLTSSVIKVVIPSDLGTVVPNPIYKIADFIMDVKTIIKFIKDLITLVMDIINHVNKLARIMLNGINNLAEIIEQIMEILGLQWFIDLVQNIIDFFGGKITEARPLLENMLSPVYYKDTDEYESTLEALDELLNDDTDELSKGLTGLNGDDRFFKIDDMSIAALNKTVKVKEDGEKEEITKYEEIMNQLDEKAEEIVAYRSPILAPVDEDEENHSANLTAIMDDGGAFNTDVKFIGWHYFHPNLDEFKDSKGNCRVKGLRKRIKNRIIKKASKTSNKKRGGMSMMHRKHVIRREVTAYDAFYWYTYYTEDILKDCYMHNTDQNYFIDSVTTTENGTIVELEDGRRVFVANNNVRSGDYVTVEGQRYRVR